MIQLIDLAPGTPFMLMRTRERFVTHGRDTKLRYRVRISPIKSETAMGRTLHISCAVKPLVRVSPCEA